MELKKINVQQLPVNKYITAPVYLDENYILISPDNPVKQELIHRLAKWEFRDVLTAGQPSTAPPKVTTAPGETSTGVLETSTKEKEDIKHITKFYLEKSDYLRQTFNHYKKTGQLRIADLTEKIKEIISEVKNNKPAILVLPEECQKDDNYLIISSIRATVFTIVIAENLRIPPHKMIELGIAGLLHDIGLVRLPEALYTSQRPLSERERQVLSTHPILGFQALKAAEFPLSICLAVLEHQENIDGTGYPRKLRGDKISLYGKVLSVACSYEAATAKRPYKEQQDGHSGIMDLLSQMGKRYDETILKSLIYTLSIYPVGTYVEMTDGAKGIVAKTVENNPKYPVIQLLLDKNENTYVQKPLFQPKAGEGVQIKRALNQNESKELLAKISFSED